MAKIKQRAAPPDTILDWQFPNEEAWTQAQASVAAPPTLTQARSRGLFGKSVILLLLAAVGVVYSLWHQAKREDQQHKSALLQMIAQEHAEIGASNHPIRPALPDQAASALRQRTPQDQHGLWVLALGAAATPANVTIADVAWRGEFALVQVVVSQPEMTGIAPAPPPLRYRQTRVYRYTGSGWQPTQPTTEVWGAVQRLQTNHFTLLFGEQDQQAVTTVAATLDNVYALLRQDFDLPAANASERITVELSVEVGKEFSGAFHASRLVVPSPTLLPIATELSSADVLAQHLVTALVSHMSHETRHTGIDAPGVDSWEWHNLRLAIQRWQLWQHNPALTAWHHQITAWVYTTTQTMPRSWPIDSAKTLADLCRKAHVIEAAAPENWPALTPWCMNPERLQQLSIRGKLAFYLAELVTPTTDWATQGAAWPDWYHYIPLETLLDYAVHTYGRDRLPVLLAALGQHHRWETLIPTVFHVSATEFERGWQAYLRLHYDGP